MSERLVVIYVDRDFRDKVKSLKKELTYQQYFDNLLEEEINPPGETQTKSKRSKIL
jgi:hypothetical protein